MTKTRNFINKGFVDPPLGAAPAAMIEQQKVAWEMFRTEMPWLKRSDRAMVRAACILRSRLDDTNVSRETVDAYAEIASKLMPCSTPTKQ